MNNLTRVLAILTKLAAAILILGGATLFIPSLYEATTEYCVIYLSPPFGVPAVTSPYALEIIRVSIRLMQLVLVLGGVALYVRVSRASRLKP